MEFVKMHGLGNDFVVFEGPIDPTPGEISAWCDRRRGIGADGVLEVMPLDEARVQMRYWNADGEVAEMCGNGLRCVARYAYDRGWVGEKSFTVVTAVGDLPVEIIAESRVRAWLGVPTAEDGPVTPSGIEVHRVGMGNPHAVIFVDDAATVPVGELGPRIENDELFPEGTNVEFAEVLGRQSIELRVWERGVGETLACGTGAAAAAFLAHRQGRTGSAVEVRLPGGSLDVEIDERGAWIEGPVHLVYRGSIGRESAEQG